ncbi:MAG: hypothetical protein Q9219_003508 [cf. Caloplaca sp. 3 TL-2023]
MSSFGDPISSRLEASLQEEKTQRDRARAFERQVNELREELETVYSTLARVRSEKYALEDRVEGHQRISDHTTGDKLADAERKIRGLENELQAMKSSLASRDERASRISKEIGDHFRSTSESQHRILQSLSTWPGSASEPSTIEVPVLLGSESTELSEKTPKDDSSDPLVATLATLPTQNDCCLLLRTDRNLDLFGTKSGSATEKPPGSSEVSAPGFPATILPTRQLQYQKSKDGDGSFSRAKSWTRGKPPR